MEGSASWPSFSFLPSWLEHDNWFLNFLSETWCDHVTRLCPVDTGQSGKRKGCEHPHPLHFHPVWCFENFFLGKMEADDYLLPRRPQWQTKESFPLSWVWWTSELIGLPYTACLTSCCTESLHHSWKMAWERLWVSGVFFVSFPSVQVLLNGVGGAVGMRALPYPLVPSVRCLTHMWIKGQVCAYKWRHMDSVTVYVLQSF